VDAIVESRPELTKDVRSAMHEETEKYFAWVMRENRPDHGGSSKATTPS
jgi:hypothetical protein